MTWFYTFIASIVEGLTEFLPISSTGHLIILNHLLRIKSSTAITSFNIFIQLGAILAVASLYYKELIKDKIQLLHIAISFLPTAIVGFTFYPLIKSYLLDNITVTTISLLLGGVVIFYLPSNKKIKANLTYFDYFKIGLFQSISIIPGTSRALMSIIGALYSGMDLAGAIKYSFLLALPTIGAATALDLLKNKDVLLQNPQDFPKFLVGFLVAFLTAKLTLNFFLNYSKNHGLRFFGYYRIVLALLISVLFIFPL